MNLSNYSKLKETGNAHMLRLGNATILSLNRYDQETGEKLDSEIIVLNNLDIFNRYVESVNQANSLKLILDDMQELESDGK